MKSEPFFIILFFLCLILGVAGVISIFYSTSLSEYLSKDVSHQGLSIGVNSADGYPRINILYNVHLKQDFSKNEGEFSFAIRDPINIDSVQFAFGNISKDFGCSLLDCSIQELDAFNNIIENKPLSCIMQLQTNSSFVVSFKGQKFENESILIKYRLHLIPNGDLTIEQLKQQWDSSGPKGNLILELGSDYECYGSCVYDYTSKTQILPSSNYANELFLRLNPTDYFTQLYITTKSTRIIAKKNFFLSIGVSFIAGVIFAFISILIGIKQEKPKFKEYIKKLIEGIKKIEKPKFDIKTKINFELIVIFFLIIISSFLQWNSNNYINLITIYGLFFLTCGAVIGLRPVLRNLINPGIKSEERKKRDINAAFYSFAMITLGFGLQFWAQLLVLLHIATDLNSEITSTVILSIIVLVTINLAIRKLKVYEG